MPSQIRSTDAELRDFLEGVESIAVVGLSPKPHRASHRVAAYLQGQGFRIIPVNPAGGTILGEPVYPDLAAVCANVSPKPDLVDVFRRPEALPDLVEQAIACGASKLWFQLGVTHPQAEARALASGIELVVDRCLLVEHQRL